MIVDDSDRFLQAACRMLAGDGFAVVGAATDGDQGARLVADLCPDLALIDLYLGAANGLELIADLVDSGLAEHTFTILISSYSDEDLRSLCEYGVADGYLSKPDLSGDAVRAILRGAAHGAVPT
ncbi:response regulator [Actinomadura sp. DC4]|uniref:response regulator n=1 Tax=Actinomadura sp. DC4 TaxID=3055069 RepID=UPI0025B08928|nr:response regulator [Actinomadura sp. DC4]MDN3354514.1 response regulator [Actinomadura sp. DC4]